MAVTMSEEEIMWKDALGAAFKAGDTVAYYRNPGAVGGSNVVVTGTVVGPAKSGSDSWIVIDMSDSSLELLQRLGEIVRRKRPVSRRVHSVSAASCILINGHPSISQSER